MYSEDDALHRNYMFFEDTIGALPKYVWSSISRACSILPSCSATIFLANFKTSVLINIYDDRGMDILVSDADSALPLINNSLTTVSKL